jgi:cholesterol transport system auxiliary component
MNRARRALTVAAAASAFAGCALLAPAEREMSTAVLDKLPGALPHRDARPVKLLVFAPEAKPIYDTAQMAYSLQAHQVAYFRDHQWAQPPSQMLQPLLARTLEATGYFGAVLMPPYTGRYDYALRTEIIELLQDFASEPAAFRLSLRLRLSDDAANRLVATKEIALREPMRQKKPDAGVVAANDALAKALQEVARFVLENAD